MDKNKETKLTDEELSQVVGGDPAAPLHNYTSIPKAVIEPDETPEDRTILRNARLKLEKIKLFLLR